MKELHNMQTDGYKRLQHFEELIDDIMDTENLETDPNLLIEFKNQAELKSNAIEVREETHKLTSEYLDEVDDDFEMTGGDKLEEM